MDWNIALEMAALSLASYEDDSEAISEWYERVHFVKDKNTSTEAYLVSGNGIRVIAIRGTDSTLDWLWNFSLCAGKCKRGRHHGFNESAMRLMHTPEYLDFLSWPGPIFLTGHSKGGAIAQIISLYLERTEAVICFGCPRVGNRHYRREYRAKHTPTYLFQNRMDMVSRLPPWLLGYVHVDDLIKLPESGHDMAIYLEEMSKKI